MTKTLRELADVEYGASPKEIRVDYSTPHKIFGTGGLVGYSCKPLFDGPLVVVARKGTLDNPIFSEDACWVIDTAYAVIPKKGNDAKWLYYQLLNYDLKRLNEATGVPSISRDFLYRVTFTETKPLVQRKIARILSTVDAVIEQTEQTVAKYQSIKAGMLQDLFTRGLDANGVLRPHQAVAPHLYKQSELGWIPVEWEAVQLKECVDPIMSNVDKHVKPDETRVPLCNYMDVYNNRYLSSANSFSIGSVNASEMLRFSLRPQDVIITKDSETPDDIAVPAVLTERIENLICGYHLCILRSKDLGKLNGEFLMLQLQLPNINAQFAVKANGSTRYGLTIDAIETVYVKRPTDVNEQTEITKRLKSLDNKLETEQTYLHKLQKLKAGLMNDLLSGNKPVVVEEETAASV